MWTWEHSIPLEIGKLEAGEVDFHERNAFLMSLMKKVEKRKYIELQKGAEWKKSGYVLQI